MNGQLTRMECLLHAKELLEAVAKEDLERVIVFGMKGDDIRVYQSKSVGRLEFMGALVVALMETWGIPMNKENCDDGRA